MNPERWQKLMYCGIIIGIGLGIITAEAILMDHPKPLLNLAALTCIVGGVIWGRVMQRRRLKENKTQKDGEDSN